MHCRQFINIIPPGIVSNCLKWSVLLTWEIQDVTSRPALTEGLIIPVLTATKLARSPRRVRGRLPAFGKLMVQAFIARVSNEHGLAPRLRAHFRNNCMKPPVTLPLHNELAFTEGQTRCWLLRRLVAMGAKQFRYWVHTRPLPLMELSIAIVLP